MTKPRDQVWKIPIVSMALLAAVGIAPARADDDCRTGGACNYDGWQKGGCYDSQLNWSVDLPCIDRFGNWRGLANGDPLPGMPDGYIPGRPMGGFGAHPHLDPRLAGRGPEFHGGPGAMPRAPEMPHGGPGGMPRAPEMPRMPQTPRMPEMPTHTCFYGHCW